MFPPASDQPKPAATTLKKLCAIRLPYLILLIILAIGAGFYGVENWRGPYVFRQRCAELEAQGEKLKVERFQTAAVPAEENFMMSPAWGEALKSRDPWDMEFPLLLRIPREDERDSDTMRLEEWAPWEDRISALAEAAAVASYSVFPTLPGAEHSLTYARAMCDSLLFRARAAQRDGNAKAAAESLRILFRMYDAFAARPESFNQLCAVAIAGISVFGPFQKTPWSKQESEMIASGLKRMNRIPDFALAMRYDRALTLQYLVNKEGSLVKPPSSCWMPRGWSGLAFTWWLDLSQFRIEAAAAWPGEINKFDPRLDSKSIWQGFARLEHWSDESLDQTRIDSLVVKMHVVLCQMEHAFGWYRREHGRDIEKPEDLEPYLAGGWPTDPYTQKPYLIDQDEDRWCIRWNRYGLPPGPGDIWSFPSRPENPG